MALRGGRTAQAVRRCCVLKAAMPPPVRNHISSHSSRSSHSRPLPCHAPACVRTARSTALPASAIPDVRWQSDGGELCPAPKALHWGGIGFGAGAISSTAGRRPSSSCCAAASASSSSTSGSGYWTVAQPVTYTEVVKASKFVVTAWPVASGRQAMELVRGASDPAASHNCFAYRVGQEFRSSDDGEPGGTAGRPILGAIEGEGLDGVCVLVTRYFGGTKLGAGGLVRAYGGSARECLRQAPRAYVKRKVTLQVRAPYDVLGSIYSQLDRHGAERLDEQYAEDGSVAITAQVDEEASEALCRAIADGTSGRVQARPVAAAAEEEEGE